MNPVVWRREWDSNPLAMNGDSNSLESQAAQTGLNFLCPFRIRDHLHRAQKPSEGRDQNQSEKFGNYT
jgi:hypothetical protein